ncbi:hypothetical protein JXJ21_21710 [candidate division KSB1 bacterium]|nr:hypothetical protein [candidate division KSB1 bacterium]
MLNLESRLELFVDAFLVEKLKKTTLILHEPRECPTVSESIKGGYCTVIKDGDLYRFYYRDIKKKYIGERYDGSPGEYTCYAESRDGITWSKPNLGLFEIEGSRDNNAILADAAPCSHNFSPFIDIKPGVREDQRFKALAGVHQGGGLVAFSSPDGIHWQKMRIEPVITSEGFGFDSQNVAFWSEHENCYVCYFRTMKSRHGELRTISRTTSEDFIHWTPAILIDPNEPGEHLYTNQTHPYFRAPHIYIALPTRFMPDRGNSTDILFMSSRGGNMYDRSFKHAFIRPGLHPERWGNRSNYAVLNVVPNSPTEMSLYSCSNNADLVRYVLRTDGFVSVHADFEEGELLTKYFKFSGSELIINFSSSAAGSILVEIQDTAGSPIPGFRLEECIPAIGDAINHIVTWKHQSAPGKLAGHPIRLRFVMKEADLYSLRFS